MVVFFCLVWKIEVRTFNFLTLCEFIMLTDRIFAS